jgi:hypothetical protein
VEEVAPQSDKEIDDFIPEEAMNLIPPPLKYWLERCSLK